jgi:hypothetical protein
MTDKNYNFIHLKPEERKNILEYVSKLDNKEGSDFNKRMKKGVNFQFLLKLIDFN